MLNDHIHAALIQTRERDLRARIHLAVAAASIAAAALAPPAALARPADVTFGDGELQGSEQRRRLDLRHRHGVLRRDQLRHDGSPPRRRRRRGELIAAVTLADT